MQPTLDDNLSNSDPIRREVLRSFGNSLHAALGTAGADVFPRMNITQDDENVYLHAEIPGVDPDQLSIRALGNSVSLAGKRSSFGVREHTGDDSGCADCAFDCTVALPTEVDAERVDAGYCDGVLAVTLPKARRPQARRRVEPGHC